MAAFGFAMSAPIGLRCRASTAATRLPLRRSLTADVMLLAKCKFSIASGRRVRRRQYLDAAKRGHAATFDDRDLRRQLPHLGWIVADIDHGNAGFVAQANEIGQDLFLTFLVK